MEGSGSCVFVYGVASECVLILVGSILGIYLYFEKKITSPNGFQAIPKPLRMVG